MRKRIKGRYNSFLWRRVALAPSSLGAGDSIRGKMKKMDLSLGSQIDWPWKQTEDSKRTTWWAGIQERLEDVWEAAKV